ncbi:hypothetical protein EJB05_38406, partial [Eragrostis curvula]
MAIRATYIHSTMPKSMSTNVNWYPPCPDPSLTMGLLPHCDRPFLTVLSQGDVSGLQAKHRGRLFGIHLDLI